MSILSIFSAPRAAEEQGLEEKKPSQNLYLSKARSALFDPSPRSQAFKTLKEMNISTYSSLNRQVAVIQKDFLDAQFPKNFIEDYKAQLQKEDPMLGAMKQVDRSFGPLGRKISQVRENVLSLQKKCLKEAGQLEKLGTVKGLDSEEYQKEKQKVAALFHGVQEVIRSTVREELMPLLGAALLSSNEERSIQEASETKQSREAILSTISFGRQTELPGFLEPVASEKSESIRLKGKLADGAAVAESLKPLVTPKLRTWMEEVKADVVKLAGSL